MRTFTTAILFVLSALIMNGCRVHRAVDPCAPMVCIPEEYTSDSNDGVEVCEWWEQYNSRELNAVVQRALCHNLTLKQSYWQVVQACAQARIAAAGRWPEINLNANATQFKSSFSDFSRITSGAGATNFGTGEPIDLYTLQGTLSYEIDLWRRVNSEAAAACYQMHATNEDLEATALTLTGTVVDLWFTIQEQLILLKVIDHQIDISKTLLGLVELRFSVGESSALDVYQQRLQLASIETEKPPVLATLQTSINHLHVLLGEPPMENWEKVDGIVVELPPSPQLGSPVDLLEHRPDLRAEQRRLMATDYEIAAAIADLFPRLNFSLSYGFQSGEIKDLFRSEIYRIAGDLLQPIFDAGRRRAEVSRRQAMLSESLARYSHTFLTALQEVEDALAEEKYQLELVKQIDKEIELATSNLTEARSRYVNGLNDYLTVIAAVQSLQNLERRKVTEDKRLLVNRSKLYRSLGGPYLVSMH